MIIKKKTKHFIFLTILVMATSLVFPMASSNWLIGNEPTENDSDDIQIESDNTLFECCKLFTQGKKDALTRINSNKRYVSIEQAVKDANAAAANGKVFIRMNRDINNSTNKGIVKIKQDITLNSNVYLDLPYAEAITSINENIKNDSPGKEGYGKPNGQGFSDNSIKNADTNCYVRVVVEEGVTVTINQGAYIRIGGEIGVDQSSCSVACHTTGAYSEMILRKNSKIINNGSFETFGYLRSDRVYTNFNEKPSLINKNSSTTITPFVFYNWPGGSNLSSRIVNQKTFPFTDFEFCNLATLSVFEYGSKLVNSLVIGVPLFNPKKITITSLGPDTLAGDKLFTMFSGSKVYVDYIQDSSEIIVDSKGTENFLTTGKGKSNYILEGHTALNNLNIDTGIGEIGAIGTKTMSLPVGRKMNIKINTNSTCDCNVRVKCLTGSKITIEKGATFNINADFMIMEKFSGGHGQVDHYGNNKQKPSYFINNGVVNIGMNGAKLFFGGRILSNINGSLINIGANVISNCANGEGNGGTQKLSDKGSMVAEFIPKDSQTEVATAASYNDTNNNITIDKQKEMVLLKNNNYTYSELNGWQAKLVSGNKYLNTDYFKIHLDTKTNLTDVHNVWYESKAKLYSSELTKWVKVFISPNADGSQQQEVWNGPSCGGALIPKDWYYYIKVYTPNNHNYDFPCKLKLDGQPMNLNTWYKIPNRNIDLRLPCVGIFYAAYGFEGKKIITYDD